MKSLRTSYPRNSCFTFITERHISGPVNYTLFHCLCGSKTLRLSRCNFTECLYYYIRNSYFQFKLMFWFEVSIERSGIAAYLKVLVQFRVDPNNTHIALCLLVHMNIVYVSGWMATLTNTPSRYEKHFSLTVGQVINNPGKFVYIKKKKKC